MPRLVLTTLPGIERLAQREAALHDLHAEILTDGVLLIEEASWEAYVRLAYEARTLTQVFPLLARLTMQDDLAFVDDDVLAHVKRAGSVRITRVHGLKAYEREVAQTFLQHIQLPVSLHEPAVHLGFAQLEDAFLIGPLLHPFNLCKRHYRLYTVPNTPSSCLAASLLHLDRVTHDERVADLIGYDGTFILEYAAYAKNLPVRHDTREPVSTAYKQTLPAYEPRIRDTPLSIFYADKQPNHVYRARQNARLLGVEREITFTKLSLEWLELKLQEDYYTIFIGRLPGPSQRFKEKHYARLLDDYFRLAAIALTREGRILLLTPEERLLEEHASAHGFTRRGSLRITRGDSILHASLFTRQHDG